MHLRLFRLHIRVYEFSFQDPTATVSASVHRKVFAHAEFGKDAMTVGSVLVLQKVFLCLSLCVTHVLLASI